MTNEYVNLQRVHYQSLLSKTPFPPELRHPQSALRPAPHPPALTGYSRRLSLGLKAVCLGQERVIQPMEQRRSEEPATLGPQAAGPRSAHPNVLGSSTTFIFPARVGAGPAESEVVSRERKRGRRRRAGSYARGATDPAPRVPAASGRQPAAPPSLLGSHGHVGDSRN